MATSGKNLLRLLIILAPLVYLALAPSTPQAQRSQVQRSQVQRSKDAPVAEDPFAVRLLPFLEDNCIACHNARRSSGELNLEQYKTAAAIHEHRETFERVVYRIRSGEMPPKGAPRPEESEMKAVLQWIEGEFARADRMAKPDPGRVTARRLNRAEYNNTVRDLLGVDLEPAEDFPQDDSGYGFDNIGDVLSLSPGLMEKYLTAAERIARTALFGPEQLKPTLTRLPAPGRRIVQRNAPLFEYDATGLSLPNARHVVHRFPADGEYNFRAFFGGVRPLGSEPLQVAFWIDGRQVEVKPFDPEHLASFADDRQDLGGQTLDFRVRVPAGKHWIAVSFLRLYDGLPPKYEGPNPSKRPQRPAPEFRPPPNLPPERLAEFRRRFEARIAEVIPVNDARVGMIEVGGPYGQKPGPSPESIKKIYVCGHAEDDHAPGCARRIVANLARRAYRRPVAKREVDQLLDLVAAAQRDGESLSESLSVAIQAILVSPHFLFRIEGAEAQRQRAAARVDGVEPLGQYELASRLSYFLWSSMPDEELMRAAQRGQLRLPAVLEAQVRRMLKDARSSALVENFGGQWLELRRLESVKPDQERFPEFEEYLRMSMLRETELFFEEVVRSDRSILDFIDADYTFLNERLAKFYRIPGVEGPQFRRVALTASTNRGGVLTQASVLTVSSYATRTSPVLRGKWILENILNAPPPPPPPGVPNLDEAAVGTSASLRQQLEEHRKNPTCASCHARMDPLGFGLENFDAIGAWRTEDGKFPIDASGVLPDGRSFRGATELKTILRADRDAFAEGLTEKLLTYGLGRGLERYDRMTVKKIAGNAAARDYRFSSLVLEIVNSLPFQMRRGEKSL
ncbi:MAG: DUF1592 domain-containing protein [Acidobacteria bacterium]|nr:DUF1592 domain-containing protein [Acidobacteriota bacterium]